MDAEREASRPPVSTNDSANESFRLTVDQAAGVLLVRLHGSAGMEHTEDLQRRLLELPGKATCRIVLDLSDLHFVNSAGLGAFIALYRRCREFGGQVALARPREAVAQVLRVTNLDRLMRIYPDPEAAIRDLQTQTPVGGPSA